MTIITSIKKATKKSQNQVASNTLYSTDSKVVNIRSARKAQQQAQQELLDYMLWTMKHDMDPHRIYDDPIDVFRSEMKAMLNVAS